MKKKEVKTTNKKEEKKTINKKTVAMLYLLCSLCWLISGVFEVKADTSGTLSFIVGGILLILGFIYYYLFKKSQK
ncbi:MAG: LPXTG cell wall anchor domain-containing protein [Bacilli bacterium]|nr:LPXTG cell wall anchor domain-containing protein [Bacilli bacterium]